MTDFGSDPQHGKRPDLPSKKLSDQRIKKDAPKAIETLDRLGAMDLIEPLGLTPYFKR